MDFGYYIDYFHFLEKRLLDTKRYVAFEKENLDVFSIEFASIINDCCGIINGFCFELCQAENPKKDRFYMNDYIDYFDRHKFILSCLVYCEKFSIIPWERLQNKKLRTPAWWTAYNEMKHSGKPNFQNASLKNAISCLAGLYCLLSAYELILSPNGVEDYICETSLFGITAYNGSLSWKC